MCGYSSYNANMTQKIPVESLQCARIVVDIASDYQASDIVMLDISQVSQFADFFVILTAESSRQIETLFENIKDGLKRIGVILHHREGSSQAGWVLLDFGDVIVHFFGPEEREFYQIEGAWPKATEVVRIQ